MTFVFISTMRAVPWGGSEVLWYRTAVELLQRGQRIHTLTYPFRPVPSPLAEIARRGATVSFQQTHATGASRIGRRFFPGAFSQRWSRRHLEAIRGISSPRVVISCGSLLDDFAGLDRLASTGVPYVLLIQAAGSSLWPDDTNLDAVTRLVSGARKVFFVSQHNRNDVEQFVGRSLPSAELIHNAPDLPTTAQPLPAPPPLTDRPLRLACVGRLCVAAKGQDALLQTLALPKWRNRSLTLTLCGSGPNERALRNLVDYHRLAAVRFAGQVNNVTDIWRDHDVGVLPSRYEGMPLTIIEAMALGRAHVTTATCGGAEIIEDNITGFLAADASVASLDEALERAWTRRHELAEIGALAARRIRQLIRYDPPVHFANRLLELLGQ